MKTKFFYCPICGNVVVKVIDSGVTPHCCGQEMVELKPGHSDGDGEKHLPVVAFHDGDCVKVEVGSQPHPMLPEHHVRLIVLETDRGLHIRHLDQGKPAVAEFCIRGEKALAAYEYCNVHGLWMSAVQCGLGCSKC